MISTGKGRKRTKQQKDEAQASTEHQAFSLLPVGEFQPKELSLKCLLSGPGRGLLRAPEFPPARVIKYSKYAAKSRFFLL